jgi:hypothetical protein
MVKISITRKQWFFFTGGLVLGVAVLLAVRFATYKLTATHYHANLAVFINGQQEEFKGPQYYQEVGACTANGPIQPAQRAHLHDNINSVIHVHDNGVTWNQFFQNIGWDLSSNYISNYQHVIYQANGDSRLHIILNGQDLTDLTSISNQVIGDRDRLLISFGNVDNKTLQTEYSSVPSTAKHYDESNDPASCAGQMQKVTISDRFRHLL